MSNIGEEMTLHCAMRLIAFYHQGLGLLEDRRTVRSAVSAYGKGVTHSLDKLLHMGVDCLPDGQIHGRII